MALRPKLFYRTRFKNQEQAERAQVAFRRGGTSAVGSSASFFQQLSVKELGSPVKNITPGVTSPDANQRETTDPDYPDLNKVRHCYRDLKTNL